MASAADEIAALRGTKPATLGNLLRLPSFSRLFQAMAVTSLGDWVGFVAVVALVTRLGAAAAGYAVSGVMLARLVPALIFGPFAGVLVDRFDRKRLMIVADVGRGAMYATMPFVQNLPTIFVLSFAIECLSLLWTPSKDSILPNLVPRRQLLNANTLGLIASYGTLPLGGILYTALAGFGSAISGRVHYFRLHEEALALWLDAFTFVFSALMIWRLDVRTLGRKASMRGVEPTGLLSDFTEGVRFLRQHTFARAMTFGIVLGFAGVGSVIGLSPIFARYTLDAPQGWGLLVTAMGIGLGSGMLSAGRLAKVIERDTLFPLAIVFAASSLVVLAGMPNIATAALLTVITGMGAGAAWVTGYTLLQENVADELRGRTFGSLTVLSRLGLFISLAGFPALAVLLPDYAVRVGGQTLDLSGTRLAMWVSAGVVLTGGFLSRRGLRISRLTRPRPLTLRPRLRKLERRGAFIVFEGVEGAGKGTQMKMAREFLEQQGYEVLMTREPGGTELGERLRRLILDNELGHMDAHAEALLFSASRAQHVASVIRPALEEGKVVLCDRYIDSSVAYQAAGRGLSEQDVLSLNVWATQGLFPDLVILLNLEPGEGLARVGEELDRIELEGSAFLARVAEAFLRIADEHPERFVVVEAGDAPDVVQKRVREELTKFLKAQEEK
ncbi:MAG TPA: dTMP kinase [Actinomycetota bacterium]|nr:dTMP kinase [Actinomycetota bacterium]